MLKIFLVVTGIVLISNAREEGLFSPYGEMVLWLIFILLFCNVLYNLFVAFRFFLGFIRRGIIEEVSHIIQDDVIKDTYTTSEERESPQYNCYQLTIRELKKGSSELVFKEEYYLFTAPRKGEVVYFIQRPFHKSMKLIHTTTLIEMLGEVIIYGALFYYAFGLKFFI